MQSHYLHQVWKSWALTKAYKKRETPKSRSLSSRRTNRDYRSQKKNSDTLWLDHYLPWQTLE